MLKSITVKEAGRKGGIARAKSLTPEQRTESARMAGNTRGRDQHAGGKNGEPCQSFLGKG